MIWENFFNLFRRRPAGIDETLSGAEKRSNWRINRRVGLIGTLGNGEQIELMGLNFGPGGLRAQLAKTSRILVVGEHLTLMVARKAPLKEPAGETPVKEAQAEEPPVEEPSGEKVEAEARVVWARKARAGHQVGLSFVLQAESPAVARFLLDCGVAPPDGHEKRRAPRLATKMIPGVLSADEGQVTDIEVYDLAIGGALVKSRVPIPERAVVSLSIFLHKYKDSLDLAGVVVRSRPGEESQTCLLGIHFTGVSPENRKRLLDYLSRTLKSR